MDVIEFQILYTLQELRTPLVDGLMVFITSLGDHGWFWILMGVLLFSFPRTRILGGCMLISIAAGFLLGNVMLKNIAARQRPCWLDPSVELLVAVPKDFSFPSGHSLVSFEGAVCIFLFNRKWGIPALMLAVLTAFSRLYLFVHFPTDVLAGIVMGTVIAWSVVRTAKRRMKKRTGCQGNHDMAAGRTTDMAIE